MYLALSEEGVNDGGPRGYERGLEHVGQQAQYRVEALPLTTFLLHLRMGNTKKLLRITICTRT